jgi:hypothetical protein
VRVLVARLDLGARKSLKNGRLTAVSHRVPHSARLRLLATGLAVALLAAAGEALATHGDPQEKLTPADNARARAMLLRKSDLGPGYTSTKPSTAEPHFYCRALDESDLTVTGDAESPEFERGFVFASSVAQVYESVADAAASWKRGTSAAGERCARVLLRKGFAREGVRLVSMRRLVFPRVSSRSIAYRVELAGESQGVAVTVVLDLVVLMHSRAQAALFFGSAFVPVPRADEIRLARVVASRMATAMRGA